MTTALHDVVVLEANEIARVCAYCVPPARLDAINRQYPGQVSHGMCPRCFVRLTAELADAAVARRKRQAA